MQVDKRDMHMPKSVVRKMQVYPNEKLLTYIIYTAGARAFTVSFMMRECIFDDMYTHACAVADGVLQDDTFLPLLYELDERGEWADPAAWMKANPALGSVKKIDDLAAKVERAKQNPKNFPGCCARNLTSAKPSKRRGYLLTASTMKAALI